MGKLHKIRKAFDEQTDKRKRYIWYHGSGCYFRDGQVVFTLMYPQACSYKRFVHKIATEWLREHLRA
jgi:hypothetical protein